VVPTVFDLCEPRADVLAGTASDSDFAADLAHVLRGHGGPDEYTDPGLRPNHRAAWPPGGVAPTNNGRAERLRG
jgi:hypothetical protein